MDLAELEIFRTVVEEGGITAAARRLHRVQSNVTTRIRQLEESLGVTLFQRDGRRLAITAAGSTLYRHAVQLLDMADAARAAVSGEETALRLRLGAMESVAATQLPPVLAAFCRAHPETQVELQTAPSRQLVEAVTAGMLDAALVGEDVDNAQFVSHPLWTEELCLVADTAQAHVRTARDVRGRALLVFRNGCAYRARLEQWMTSARIAPQRVVEIGSYHALLACASAGVGIGAVPRSLLEQSAARENVSVHRLPKHLARVRISLIGPRHEAAPARERLTEFFTGWLRTNP